MAAATTAKTADSSRASRRMMHAPKQRGATMEAASGMARAQPAAVLAVQSLMKAEAVLAAVAAAAAAAVAAAAAAAAAA